MAGSSEGAPAAVASSALPLLQFVPWQSAVDLGFWQKLASRKLHEMRLSEAEQALAAHFTPCNHAQLSSPLHVGADAWLDGSSEASQRAGRAVAPGSLLNTNTLDGFKQSDKKALLQASAAQVWADIVSGEAERHPALLNRFFLLTFADLKKWDFVYWFAFPALVLPHPARAAPLQPVSALFSSAHCEAMSQACQAWKQAPTKHLAPALQALHLGEGSGTEGESESVQGAPFFLLHLDEAGGVMAHALHRWQHLQQQAGRVVAVFLDPCHLPTHPGWPLRNLLAVAVARWGVRSVDVVALKETRGRPDWDASMATTVHLPDVPEWRVAGCACPAAVGWERSVRGGVAPRMAALGPSLDPLQLATASVDLNLQLMRWRLLPSLDLPRLAATRCLLLGAGTLGCAVARGLLAWGVRDMTLVDSGLVSFSNPVRQSLFTHADCLNGGRPKAEAAAAALRAIFPGVRASGVRLSIPMPGHAVGDRDAASVLEAAKQVEQLVTEHDVIFLLTDTRESRWLPTLLAATHNKLAINAALGFDTYLVMRHGAGPSAAAAPSASSPSPRLGCYFCNDVVAPLDSTAGRTLDQQCTVTRPGLAPIAAGIAVELMVALLHHPFAIHAPADAAPTGGGFPGGATPHPLGLLPHQVRGFLSFFSQLLVTGHAFDKCTACSPAVVQDFQQRGSDFLLQAFNCPSFLEDLTGLTAMLRATDDLLHEWEAEEGEAGGDDGNSDDF